MTVNCPQELLLRKYCNRCSKIRGMCNNYDGMNDVLVTVNMTVDSTLEQAHNINDKSTEEFHSIFEVRKH